MSLIQQLVAKYPRDTLFILDIDSTLVLTHGRNQAILRDFSKVVKNQDHAMALAEATCSPMEYGFDRALARVGLDNTSKEFQEELFEFWKTHFFSGDYLKNDETHRGALAFVVQLHEHFPVVYLTGRHHSTMWDGTLKDMKSRGFPISEDILILKKDLEQKDELYKSEILKELHKQHKHMVIIDNEPKVLHQIEADHPNVPIIFVDTCHSPNVEKNSKWKTIKDFT